MTYIGPIIPGGGNITLVGDAKVSRISFAAHSLKSIINSFVSQAIYDQIMNINPGYNIADFNLPPIKRDLVERVPVRPTRYHLIFLRNCLLNFASRLALHAMWPVPQFTKESRREFLT
jgi:hypothetical protein